MRLAAVAALAALAAASTPAFAEQQSGSTTTDQARQGGRVVFVCDRSAESRRSFEREHGAPMTFVSADDLAKAQVNKETWTAPRCITAAELSRFEAAAEQARVMRTRAD